MTVKELYEEALEKGAENYGIMLQYQDGGGCYYGSCFMSEADYDAVSEKVTLA